MKLDHSDRLLAQLNELFDLTPCLPSEYETFQMVGLDFKAQGYESAKLGHVSVQTASGMGGAMEMESMIVNPFSVDGPLFSLDLISAQGKYTLMMELYDTLVDTPRDEAPFQAIKDRDYRTAVTLLRPYDDYNAAVAFCCMDYNESALAILERLEKTPAVNYLLAIVHSRKGEDQDAVQHYLDACGQDPSYVHRGNLDPEISVLIDRYNLNMDL